MVPYEDEDEMEMSYQAAAVSPMTSSQAFTKPSANTEVASAHRRLVQISGCFLPPQNYLVSSHLPTLLVNCRS